ncbi:hypothetical protein OG21DRAFT_1508345 [Imleria badia]|nr:hypothetical protein OG21DRAFT_1508345 [Imleria badia]
MPSSLNSIRTTRQTQSQVPLTPGPCHSIVSIQNESRTTQTTYQHHRGHPTSLRYDGAPRNDARNWPKNMLNASECIRKGSESRVEDNSPGRARGELDNPNDEVTGPDNHHSSQECPRAHTNVLNQDRGPGAHTNVLNQDRGPGGHEEEPEALRVLRAFGTVNAIATVSDMMRNEAASGRRSKSARTPPTHNDGRT